VRTIAGVAAALVLVSVTANPLRVRVFGLPQGCPRPSTPVDADDLSDELLSLSCCDARAAFSMA